MEDQIEFTMGEGLCLIIENVENEVSASIGSALMQSRRCQHEERGVARVQDLVVLPDFPACPR